MSLQGANGPTRSASPDERVWMLQQFQRLIREHIGERTAADRIADEMAFPRIMEVIWAGASRAEVADAGCPESFLVARHKEWAEAGVLGEFLLSYFALAMKGRERNR